MTQPAGGPGVVLVMRVLRVAIALLVLGGIARAGRISWGEPPPSRLTNEGRFQLGAGVSTGWRTLGDIHLRYFERDDVTLGARLRFDTEGMRAAELEGGYALGIGMMRFPSVNVRMRTDLVVLVGGGVAAPHDLVTGFAGLGLRLQSLEWGKWLLLELAVREAWVPIEATAAGAPPALERGFATEGMASVSVAWPDMRRESGWR